LQEKGRLDEWLRELDALQESKSSLEAWLELAEEENSEEALEAVEEELRTLQRRLNTVRLKTLLSQEQDKNNAFLEVHPGAGGTDAQDWAEMLLRMYTRWAEDSGYHVRVMDYLPGDEAGIKSATLNIEGNYAYGLLKGESGIHRLIRISPFDTSGRRHTAFASVDVYPEVNQEIQIEINDEDLRIDVFGSSGPGGQSVNTTSSAIRITHLPTGIVVQCQNEKSQIRNREGALKILRSRLYELELEKIEEEKQQKYNEKSAISWGSQIRTYTLQPHRLIKDHRNNTESTNVDRVLDGELDVFLHNHLLHQHSRKTH